MTDYVEKLRRAALNARSASDLEACEEAAAEITRLRSELSASQERVKKMEEALRKPATLRNA